MIKSNLRMILSGCNIIWCERRGRISDAYNALTQGGHITQPGFFDFAEVLEQNVVPSAFRNEVLPILLDGARTGHYLDAAADARDRALVRTVLDYDWKDTDVVEALDPPTLFPTRAGVVDLLSRPCYGIEHIIVSDVVDKAYLLSDYAEPDNSQAGIERGSIVRMLEREGLRAAADLVRSCAHHREPA